MCEDPYHINYVMKKAKKSVISNSSRPMIMLCNVNC